MSDGPAPEGKRLVHWPECTNDPCTCGERGDVLFTTRPLVSFPKPDRFKRKADTRRAHREHQLKRDKHRARIYALDAGKCRCCGLKVYLKVKDAPSARQVGHVHEWVLRSQGGDPLDETNCLLLCSECHLRLIHGNQLDIVPRDTVRLMRGPVDFPPHIDKLPPPNRLSI